MFDLKKQESGKKKDYKKLSTIKSVIFLVLAVLILGGIWLNEKKPFSTADQQETAAQMSMSSLSVEEGGEYSDRDHVALYIHTFDKLPSNYITKTKAKDSGWVAEKGNLWEVLPGKSIGGGTFQNEEKKLPDKEGRTWKECDIDYSGGERNGKRIVYSNDGLIYYTDDHYNTFEKLYGDE